MAQKKDKALAEIMVVDAEIAAEKVSLLQQFQYHSPILPRPTTAQDGPQCPEGASVLPDDLAKIPLADSQLVDARRIPGDLVDANLIGIVYEALDEVLDEDFHGVSRCDVECRQDGAALAAKAKVCPPSGGAFAECN